MSCVCDVRLLPLFVCLIHLLKQTALFYDVSPEFFLQKHIFITGVAFAKEATVCLQASEVFIIANLINASFPTMLSPDV